MKLLSPVHFSLQPASEVAKARTILTQFQKHGFSPAIWAVDQLPADEEAIKSWTKTCLSAFPEPPVLALGLKQEEAPGSPSSAEPLETFLPLALPHIQSVMIDYRDLNNPEPQTNTVPAIKIARQYIESVRGLSPKTFIWLMLDDETEASADIMELEKSLGPLVDGFMLFQEHSWRASNDQSHEKSSKPLLKTGKPVVLAGFQYISARLRPGIEKELRANYLTRMKLYEEWIQKSGYAGYVREIGECIPSEVSVNLNILPE